jgi:hypothetical protein
MTQLACNTSAIALSDRPAHFELIDRLFGELAVEREAVSGGYRFRFEPGVFDLVASFVENERKCCPFLTFFIELSASNGPIWLRLTGPDGTRDFLDAELPEIRA